MGIDLHYSDCTIQMNGRSITMKGNNFPIRRSAISSREIKLVYHKADLRKVIAKATQLNKRQQLSLLRLLQKYEALFDGTLGKWNTDPVNIELREDAKPVSSRYYPVPKINKETFRKELFRLVDIGVLTPVQDSEWGTPVFIIPKKDGTVRFITDYCKVQQTN
jgi:hypothetical protein